MCWDIKYGYVIGIAIAGITFIKACNKSDTMHSVSVRNNAY